jgi:hypothetical protein
MSGARFVERTVVVERAPRLGADQLDRSLSGQVMLWFKRAVALVLVGGSLVACYVAFYLTVWFVGTMALFLA